MDEGQKQALLEEAKRKYPVGTEFYSAYNFYMEKKNKLRAVTEENKLLKVNISFGGIGVSTLDGCYVYYNGLWAEITKLGEQSLEDLMITLDEKIQLMEERSIK